MAKINKDDITHFIDEDIHLPTRTIYIGSVGETAEGEEWGTNHTMAERAIKNLHMLDHAAPEGDKPIKIIMNNPGGYVEHGFAIYDAIKMCKNHVTIIGFGQAYSMGSIIMQAADDRLMTPNACMMIHHGSSNHSGHVKNIEKWVEFDKKQNKRIIDMFLEIMSKVDEELTHKKVDRLFDFDTILTAEEALELNLIDGILEYDGSITRRK